MTRRTGLWGPVALLMVALFVASAQPALPEVPGLGDKVAHGGSYALLAALVYRALASERLVGLTGSRAAWAALGSAAYGASDEWHQSFVPGRTSDPRDLLADAVGASIAVVVIWACGILASRRRPPVEADIPRPPA